MKSLTKTLIALFTLLFLFSSYGQNQNVTNPVITLTKQEGNCKLVLSDNGLTKTNGNNLVTWVCGDGVSEILEIFHKNGDYVFQVGPQIKNPNANKSDWFGVTKNTNEKLTEEYGIRWKDLDGNICVLDPTVKINQ
jgi:hypothetical protein